jgi:hypothetical protein
MQENAPNGCKNDSKQSNQVWRWQGERGSGVIRTESQKVPTRSTGKVRSHKGQTDAHLPWDPSRWCCIRCWRGSRGSRASRGSGAAGVGAAAGVARKQGLWD